MHKTNKAPTSGGVTQLLKTYNDFLSQHNCKNDKSLSPTHTRIPDLTKTIQAYGGSYHIPHDKLPEFLEMYRQVVFVHKKPEYLTEKQNVEHGPLLVDFDFHYSPEVEERKHDSGAIVDMIYLYLEEIKKMYIFEQGKPFTVTIMEKSTVNRLADKTKDGIHMVVGIDMDRGAQILLRQRILDKIAGIWSHLPIINAWDKVFDEGISKGTTNWQLFGSRKPLHDAYAVTYRYEVDFNTTADDFDLQEIELKEWDVSKHLLDISAQNKENPHYSMTPALESALKNKHASSSRKPAAAIKSPSRSLDASFVDQDPDMEEGLEEDDQEEDQEEEVPLESITDAEKLKKAVDHIMHGLKPAEHFIRETHEYTQILPSKYYESGSHLLNRQVAFALKHTDERLFLSWIMLRSKADDFEYSSIPELYTKWKKHFNTKDPKKGGGGVTRKSIMYWAKQDNYEEFMRVKKSTIDYFIEETLTTCTEFDCAMVLYQMFKDKYVCCSVNSRQWYVFKNHRWEADQGNSLRLAISKDMYNLYNEKMLACSNELQQYEMPEEGQGQGDQDAINEKFEYLKKKINNLNLASVKFKRTNDKNNIIREAMEIFYDRDFTQNLDANKYLMCFTNGVVDFRTQEFRDGTPQDYISKCTGNPYHPFNPDNAEMATKSEEILKFMEQLFPVKDLNRYMWDHLASVLIGTNLNQTFNIYRGSGSNGKSKLTDLMSMTLGQYKGTVPITLVTEKRNGIGGTSSEVIQLKGVRYAVMQEPSKGAQINEGIMKELTGGDPIQARALYSESEIFMPQFKLVVCTNNLFEINSNDDGTWRRIRICDFLSKFVGDNENHTDDTQYVFPKDKELEEKLIGWAPVFGSMLVELAFKNNGFVEDCEMVKASSSRYRQGQDHIAGFVDEMILKTNCNTDYVRKSDLTNEFKVWFQNSHGGRKIPKGTEIYDYMNKRFGPCTYRGWKGLKIIIPEMFDEMQELNNSVA